MRKDIYVTGAEPLEDISIEKDGNLAEILNQRRRTVIFNDGSRKSFRIQWREEDVKRADTAQPGVYEIRGRAMQPEYGDVLVEQRADPYVLLAADGWYYFTASYPVCGTKENEQGIGYDRIVLRRAKTLCGLSDAKEVTIWHQKNSDSAFRYIWAPELHCIDGSYYVIFTASVQENNVWGIRPHLLQCVGDDLMNPENWNVPGESNLHRMEAMESDEVPFRDFSLDMTYFTNAGKHYVAWAQKENNLSDIYLAEIHPKQPWKLASKAVLLTTPEYPWEMQGNVMVNEGPAVLKHDGKIYMAFSASAVDYTYCVGILEAEETDDLLRQGAWKKYDYPFLTSADFENQCGPGHNSFTTDENGNVVIVYHARPMECSNAQDADGNYGRCEYVEPGMSALSDPCRHARARGIHFAADGLPVLHLAPEQELPEKYREVVLRVTVTEACGAGYLFVTFTDGREDGEQIYFALSRDGLHWQDLNQGNPVLTSGIGEKGVRDPFLLRSADGKHFYLIATDLRIANGKGWDVAQYGGSRALILWESDDLVNWSAERSVEIGVEQAGCVWAPEAIYDRKRDAYLVFFASMVQLEGEQEPKQRIYAVYTKDFITFSKPEIYIERDNHVIDTTIIEDGGIYYRFSKDETTKLIRMDCGDDLMGSFTEIRSDALNGLYGVEGPEAYYLKEKGAWCLIVDQFASQKGYLPLISKNLSAGEFDVCKEGSYDMGGFKKRHGSVIAITEEEYQRLENTGFKRFLSEETMSEWR